MAGPPLDIGPLIALSHSILFGQVAIQFRAQRIQPLPQCQLGVGEVGGVHAVLGLHLVEQLELTIRDMSILFYASQFFLFFRIEHPALSARGTSKRILYLLQRREADEGVAGAHVEVDVGERLDLVVSLELGDELEEEAQLADLYGLFHDVDAVEVADDDRFEDEVRLAGMVADVGPDLAEIAQGLGAVGALRTFQVVEKAFHGLEAGGVERFEDVEGGEEEGAGAAGGVENGDVG